MPRWRFFLLMLLKLLAGDAAIASQAIFVGFYFCSFINILPSGSGHTHTHHLTITAAVMQLQPAGIFCIAMAIIASQLADIGSRLFLIHGDTHVDPPACAICSGAFLVYLLNVGGILK